MQWPSFLLFLLEYAFYLLHELVGVEGVGDDLALAVGDDVVGDMTEAREFEQVGLPHLAVADGGGHQGVARRLATDIAHIGIEADAEELQIATVTLALGLELALHALALVVLAAPHADDIALGVEVGGLDGAPEDIGDGEGGQTATVAEVAQAFEAAEELVETGGVAVVLQDGLGELNGAGVVGLGRLDEVTAQEVGGEGRRGVVLDEIGHGEGELSGCLVDVALAELRELLVLTVAGDLGFAQVGGVGLDADLGALGAEDGQLGKVGEDEDEGGGVFKGDLVVEASLDDGDGIHLAVTFGTVDVELALIEALEGAFEQERLSLFATGGEEQQREEGGQKVLHTGDEGLLLLDLGQFDILGGVVGIGGVAGDSIAQGLGGIGGVTHAGIEDGLEVLGGGVGVLHIAQGDVGGGVVLVEDLREGGAVGIDVGKVLLSLGEVALGEVEVAEDFVETVGIGGAGDILLGGGYVATGEGEHAEVGLGFSEGGSDALGLLDVVAGDVVVTLGIGEGGEVVVSTAIVGIDLGGELVDLLLAGGIIADGRTVEELLDAKLGGVGLDLIEYLGIATTDGLVVDRQA